MKIFRIAQPSIDETYLQAINSHNLSIARKLVLQKAKQKGFSFGPVYHGSYSSFTQFNMDFSGKTDDGYFGKGFYFSPTKGNASEYGKAKGFLLSIHNPIKLPCSSSMGHSSLLDARDILGKVMGRNDLITHRTLPPGYHVVEQPESEWGIPTGKTEFVVHPLPELYGTEAERYGKGQPTPTEAIVAFNDDLNNTSWNSGWLFGLTKDVGREEMIDAIQSHGHDAVIIHDAEDNTTLEILVWNPSSIKSSDTQTFDDSGKIIPLSARFDPSSQDVRY